MITVNFTLRRTPFALSVHETFRSGITGIFGPSGSGKTSLLHVIAGLARPDEGWISIGDTTVCNVAAGIHLPVNKRNIGYVFQDGRLFPHMTVEKNLRYGMKKTRTRSLSFDDVVDLLKIRHLLGSHPASISGGERQRTALGRALLSSPDLLLLDEPFSAVDAGLRRQIIPYLLTLQRRIDIPVLVVSHELPDLLKLTDRLCVIKNGACIGHGDYHVLLGVREAAEVFGSGGILNAFTLTVESTDPATGITTLAGEAPTDGIRIVCEKNRESYATGQEMRIFIYAHDIALALQALPNVTIQNQVKGTVTDLYERDARTCCIVDAGMKLVVEVTAASVNRLALRRGSTVWCLFKSVAIDVAA